MKLNPREPRYFIKRSNPIVHQFKQAFQLFAKDENHTMNIKVRPQLVNELNPFYIQEIALALQHYPKLIEKFIFAITIKFEEIEGSGLYVHEDEWQASPAYMRWFNKMNTFPPTIFLLNDSEARFYFLMGDLLAAGEFNSGDKPGMLSFSDKNLQILCDRIFVCGWLFLVYCHGSGFNPKVYVEALLLEFETPVTYDMVEKEYQKQIEAGTHFRSTSKKE